MTVKLKPTGAAALRPKEIVVEVPGVLDADGEPLRLLLKRPRTDQILRILGGIPDGVPPAEGTQPAASLATMSNDYAEWDAIAQRLVALAVIEPRFSFTDPPEPDCADWGALSMAEQIAVVHAITELAGLGSGRTQALRTFPAERSAGGSAGGESGAAGDPAGAATP